MATSRVIEYFLCPEKGYAALVPPLATHGILAIAAVLAVVSSPYLGWDYSAPETAVMGVAIHAFEWSFVRLAPFALIAALVGVFLTRKKV